MAFALTAYSRQFHRKTFRFSYVLELTCGTATARHRISVFRTISVPLRRRKAFPQKRKQD
jgi:hypothetical protein